MAIAADPRARVARGARLVVVPAAGAAAQREPAARGARPVWDRAVAAAGGGGRQVMNEEIKMNQEDQMC